MDRCVINTNLARLPSGKNFSAYNTLISALETLFSFRPSIGGCNFPLSLNPVILNNLPLSNYIRVNGNFNFCRASVIISVALKFQQYFAHIDPIIFMKQKPKGMVDLQVHPFLRF